MSNTAVLLVCALAMTLYGCAREGRQPEPARLGVTVTRLPASADAGAPPAMPPPVAKLPRPNEDAGFGAYDVDAGAFERPHGAFAIISLAHGDRELVELPTAVPCVSAGQVYLRLGLVWPDGGASVTHDVVAREGAPAAVECVLVRARKAAPWRKLEHSTHVEIFVLSPRGP